MSIDSTKFNNPILRRITEGDLYVVNDINEDNANITEEVFSFGTFTPLLVAAFNGHIAVVNRLLARKNDGSYEFPEVILNVAVPDNWALCLAALSGHLGVVNRLLAKNDDGSYEFEDIIQNIAAMDNYALREAARNGHIEVVKKLLAKNDDGSYEFEDVIHNITADNNYALRWATKYGHIEVVKRLLAKNDDGSYEIPAVIQNIAVNRNYALREAAFNGHYEISYILARAQWPSGVKDIPQDLRWCVPAIGKGEIIVNKQEEALQEATQLFRWLQEGYIPTSRKDLYLPPRLSSKELQETNTLDFDVINIVNKYAGTKRSIDTSRPTNAELSMVSIRSLNLLKSSSSIMNHLEKSRIEREESEHSHSESYMPPYKRHKHSCF